MRYFDGLEDGLDESVVCSLEKPHEAADISEPERAALRCADLFPTNHLAIDEQVYDDLRSHFNEGELIELGTLCAICVGMGRLTATWDVKEGLPTYFQGGGVAITPWGAPETVTV